MRRKREKPYPSRPHLPSSFPKRRRPLADGDDLHSPSASPAAVLVIGLPAACSVLDLKSRLEIYGPISRTCIDPHGVGFVTFRSRSAADSAVSASLDPSFGITFHSNRVQVVLASDSRAERRGAIDSDAELMTHTSKLVAPLSRRGRANHRLSSAIVSSSNNDGGTSTSSDTSSTKPTTSRIKSMLDAPFKGREIVAYDDLL